MRVQTLIVFLIGVSSVVGFAQPRAGVVNKYFDESGTKEYLCAFYLEGTRYLSEKKLIPVLDSICRSTACDFCTFHDDEFYAKYPNYEGANDHYIGAYDVNTQVFLPAEKSPFENIPIVTWITLAVGVIGLVAIFTLRDKKDSIGPTKSEKST
jgi:hypothetical protein